MINSNKKMVSIIKELLTTRQMSNNELARRSGIAKSSISRYLTNYRPLSLDSIHKIATALDVSPTEILGTTTVASTDLKRIMQSSELSWGDYVLTERDRRIMFGVLSGYYDTLAELDE